VNSGHHGPMEQVSRITSSRPRGRHDGLTLKQAADSRALALASTLRELIAGGFISCRALADDLNQRRIPAARGGSWHRTTVVRMLARLGLTTSGDRNSGRTSKRAADVRAEAFRSTIQDLRKAGFVSIKAITRELNEREIPTARGGKWHKTSVRRLLQRLERLDRPSSRVT
jgi:Recombinase